MNILYVAFVRLPTEKAHGAQIMKTCEALGAEGAHVTLVLPGRKTPIVEDPFTHYGVRPVFTIQYLNTPDWVAWGPLGYAVSALWFSQAVRWSTRFVNADVVFSRDAFVLLQYLLLGRKLVYEAHTKPTVLSCLVARLAYRVIAISQGLCDAYQQVGVPLERITVAHDAVDTEPFQAHYNQIEERHRLGIPIGATVALYVGRIDAAKGADVFAAASEEVGDRIQCVLVGSGPLQNVLQRRYPKVLMLPETPYRDLPRVLTTANVLVLPNSSHDENAARYTSPLKAFAYMASGKPIVASDVPALRTLPGLRATYVRPDDPQALGKALQNSLVGSGTTPLSEVYTWRERARCILKALA